MCLCIDFAYSVHRSPGLKDPLFQNFRSSLKFKAFLWCMFSRPKYHSEISIHLLESKLTDLDVSFGSRNTLDPHPFQFPCG